MDPELQALREARLQKLKSGQQQDAIQLGDSIHQFLEPQALERLSRVSLVRPERAQTVEQYLQRLISAGSVSVSRKISEQDIVSILNGIARDEQKRNDSKIIFQRKSTDLPDSSQARVEESDDDFFD